MIVVPIGPRVQRFATAAAPAYLDAHGRPSHPRDLLAHACLRGRFASGAMNAWEFERDGEVLRLDPSGPLTVGVGAATDLAVDAAVAGTGVIHLFEDWLRPHLDGGALEPVLEPWWQCFSGPFLYYPGCRHVPAPLRALLDSIAEHREASPGWTRDAARTWRCRLRAPCPRYGKRYRSRPPPGPAQAARREGDWRPCRT